MTQSKTTKNTPTFVSNAHQAVRSSVGASIDVPTFLEKSSKLTLGARKTIVEQALILLSENYVHLPYKQAMHGVNAVQRLRLLQHQLEQSKPSTLPHPVDFHREILEVFNSLHDMHTDYFLPDPFRSMTAYLPFQVEEYYEADRSRHYLVTRLLNGFTHKTFRPGAEVLTWNGVPIERAVDISANANAGSNRAARRARGLDALTLRPLVALLPPDEERVIVGYRDDRGVEQEIRIEWQVFEPPGEADEVDHDKPSASSATIGLDRVSDHMRLARKALFAPDVVAAEAAASASPNGRARLNDVTLETSMPKAFTAMPVDTALGEFGYIRIRTFGTDDPDAFVAEFLRLVEQLPKRGLAIDVRNNGGGSLQAAECLLQLLTPKEIQPQSLQFRNTPLNLRICLRHMNGELGFDLSPWVQSMLTAVETGAVYSRAYPLTSPQSANAIGQRYHGPVALITDARCYSATDAFTAGFHDHQIGPIIGVDRNTGAGGANVWTHEFLRQSLRQPGTPDPSSPYRKLPGNAALRAAMRRTLRVGQHQGTPVEDLGVVPDHYHAMTRNDLLQSNVDLIAEVAKRLSRMPKRLLECAGTCSADGLDLKLATFGLDRVDIYVDGRPVSSPDISDGESHHRIDKQPNAELVDLRGFSRGLHVASRRIPVGGK